MKNLNDILINWNNSDFKDSGIIKASDVKKRMGKSQLIYKLDIPGRIKIFDRDFVYFNKFKDKVYINNEHIELNERGFTVNEYEPGEYKVYIDGFDELNEISDETFDDCTAMTLITVPDSVKEIGWGTFWGCINLTSITIPDSVKELGAYSFRICISLTSITIPNSMTTINAGTFWGCTNLTSITIPDSVTWIGEYAFKGCRKLKKVYVEDIDKFNKIKFEDEKANPTYYGAKLIELKK